MDWRDWMWEALLVGALLIVIGALLYVIYDMAKCSFSISFVFSRCGW